MIRAYKLMWKNWNNFKGRTSIGEFWKATLMNLIVIYAVLLGTLAVFVPNNYALQNSPILSIVAKIWAVIILVFTCASFVTGISLYIRRLRDTGCSLATMLLLLLGMPFIGGLILTVLKKTAQTRREKFLRIIEPYIHKGIIKEVQSFDTASVCLLHDKLCIYFLYTDIKRNSDELVFYFYDGAQKVQFEIKAGVEQLKNVSLNIYPEFKDDYRNGLIYTKTFKEMETMMKKYRVALKQGRYSFAFIIGLFMWIFVSSGVVLLIANIDVDTYLNMISNAPVMPILMLGWGLWALIPGGYVMLHKECWEIATKDDYI